MSKKEEKTEPPTLAYNNSSSEQGPSLGETFTVTEPTGDRPNTENSGVQDEAEEKKYPKTKSDNQGTTNYGQSRTETSSDLIGDTSDVFVPLAARDAEGRDPFLKGTGEEESSSEGKGLEGGAGHVCCKGCPCSRTLTDVDTLPMHYVVEATHRRRDRGTDVQTQTGCDCPQQGQVQRSVDRYNSNTVQLIKRRNSSQMFAFKKWFQENNTKLKPKKKVKSKKKNASTDSGDTLPQFYKAKMKDRKSTGPELFKFQAVTGKSNLPYKTPSQAKYQDQCTCQGTPLPPRFNKQSQKNNFKNYQKKELLYHKGDEKMKSKKNEPTNDQLVVKTDMNEPLNIRACLNFDGTEYISTSELPRRIDIYCFDHLNTSYFRTTDQPPPLVTDEAIQKTEEVATRFWAEIFGCCHLFISFITAFILQLYKFLLSSLLRPLICGLGQLTSDYWIKPFLTVFYNGLAQPLLVFFFNIATSLRDVCLPIARGIGYFLTEFSVVLRAIRLVESNRIIKQPAMKDSYC